MVKECNKIGNLWERINQTVMNCEWSITIEQTYDRAYGKLGSKQRQQPVLPDITNTQLHKHGRLRFFLAWGRRRGAWPEPTGWGGWVIHTRNTRVMRWLARPWQEFLKQPPWWYGLVLPKWSTILFGKKDKGLVHKNGQTFMNKDCKFGNWKWFHWCDTVLR